MKRFLFLLLLISQAIFAEDNYRAMAEEAKNNISKQTAIYRQDAEQARLSEERLTEKYKNAAIYAQQKAQSMLMPSQSANSKENDKKKNPSILIFVSFSMPEKSLKAYLHDAKKIHASVVIRGLIDNSFQKTFQQMAKLVKSSGGDGGVELNPIWFKQFGIKTVPAVVVVNENSACFKDQSCQKDRDFDVVAGDIQLSAALEMIRDRGITKDIVQSALDRLQAGGDA